MKEIVLALIAACREDSDVLFVTLFIAGGAIMATAITCVEIARAFGKAYGGTP